MIDIILRVLGDPAALIMLACGIAGGLAIGIFYRPTPGNQVSFMQPQTRSGYDLDVEKESAHVLYTRQIKNLAWKRFLKLANGYDVRKGKSIFTRFLALQGHLFTVELDGKAKTITPVAWLKTIMGEETYAKLAQEFRDKIETATIAFTVKLSDERPEIKDKLGNPSELNSLSEDDWYRVLEEKLPELVGESIERSTHKDFFEKLAYIGTGIGICMILWVLDVFPK